MMKDFAVMMPIAPEMWDDLPMRPVVRSLAARQVPIGYELVSEETSITMMYPEDDDPYEVFAVRFLYRYGVDDGEA